MFLGVMFIMDALIVGTLAGVMHSPGLGVLIGAMAVVLPLTIIFGMVPLAISAMGWGRLAARFRAPTPHAVSPNQPMTSIAVRSRGCRMTNCIAAFADDHHLRISVQFPRSPMLPDLSIPWEAVRDITLEAKMARLELADAPTIWLPARVVEREVMVRSTPVPEEVTP
jgi:hypothetical protein